MSSNKVLIVDDDSTIRTGLFRLLSKRGLDVVTASSVEEAKKFLSSIIDLALIDLRLPDGNGIELMNRLKSTNPKMESIILTGFATIDSAVQATKNGAFEFIAKPFNVDDLDKHISRALNREPSGVVKNLFEKYNFDNIIGRSSQMNKVLEIIEKVAESDSTVLITGESGTGKELVATAIHNNSKRSQKPLVPVNCGAIPSELLESELFGHVKGAFTGAIANRMGRFELSNRGTIFLDEIGELTPQLQVKLLRVIQERRFEPVGSTKTMDLDCRIIAATNMDLEKAVASGLFREDLFYRLNVIPIVIPPLRDRCADIPFLLHHFIKKFNEEKHQTISGIAPEALELLIEYSWPGNIRELENFVERMAILKRSGHIEVDDLPEKMRAQIEDNDLAPSDLSESGIDFNSAVDAYENNLILKALDKTGWNRNRAAQLLKLNRTTLVEKIKKKGLLPTRVERVDFPF